LFFRRASARGKSTAKGRLRNFWREPDVARNVRLSLVLFALVLTAPLSRADTLANVESTLSRFRGKEPMRASYSAEAQTATDGRFGNNRASSALTVEVTRSAEGVSVMIPAALLDRAAEEGRAHSGSFKNETRNGINRISPLSVAEGLNYAQAFSGILLMGTLKEEHRETRNGQSVRRLTLEVHQPMSKKEGVEIGEVKTVEDRLTLWIGDDDVPLAAHRARKLRAGFLFLHGDSEESDDWTFARHGDSLVLARQERATSFSGMGQKGSGKTVQTIVVR
jgi:hypothetical protein